MFRFFSALFYKLPPSSRLIIKHRFQPITLKIRSTNTLIKDLYVPIFVVDGSGGPNLACIGHDAVVPHLMSRIYGEPRQGELIRRVSIGSLRREITRLSNQNDLLICSLHPHYFNTSFSNNFIILPAAVTQKLILPDNPRELPTIIKTRGSQKDLNKVKRGNYSLQVTKNRDLLKFFYDELHRPFITSRHQNLAYIPRFERLVPILDEGELLLIKQDDQYVSGVLCRRLGETYQMIYSGVYHARQDLVRKGASAAEYLFSIERAIELGCRLIDFGPTAPFLNDGVLNYKKKWNAQVLIDKKKTRYIGLHIGNFRKETTRFFERNPLIALSNDKMISVFFLGHNTEMTDKELRSYIRNYRTKGSDTIIVVLLSEYWSQKKKVLYQIGQGVAQELRIVDFSNCGHKGFIPLVQMLHADS